jgi:phage shock protein A
MFLLQFFQNAQNRMFRSSSKIEEYEKLFGAILSDMQDGLIKLRQIVATSMANHKRNEIEYISAKKKADDWLGRVQLALNAGEDGLAKESLTRRRIYQDKADSLKEQFEAESNIIDTMMSTLTTVEGEISRLKRKRDLFLARVRFLKASEEILNNLSSMGSISIPIFENLEAILSQVATQLDSSNDLRKGSLEKLSNDSQDAYDIDAELQEIRNQQFQDE